MKETDHQETVKEVGPKDNQDGESAQTNLDERMGDVDTCANPEDMGRNKQENNTRTRECLNLNGPLAETAITLHRSMANQPTNTHPTIT